MPGIAYWVRHHFNLSTSLVPEHEGNSAERAEVYLLYFEEPPGKLQLIDYFGRYQSQNMAGTWEPEIEGFIKNMSTLEWPSGGRQNDLFAPPSVALSKDGKLLSFYRKKRLYLMQR